jgi:drug/metabolite transporter (DMT)-like permease
VSLLGEPIGSTVLAYFVFGEVPALLAFVGGVLVLGGLYLLVRREEAVKRVVG